MGVDLNAGSPSTSLVILSSLSLGLRVGKLRPDNNPCLLSLRAGVGGSNVEGRGRKRELGQVGE